MPIADVDHMKPQFGVCKNKVGCSFAYTGEKIPVPADSKCPECGQPLVVESSKSGGAKTAVVVIAILFLLIVLGGAVALFAFKDQILRLAFQKTDNSPNVVEAQSDKNEGAGPAVIQEPSATPASSPSTVSTPAESPPPADNAGTTPAETPPPLPPLPSSTVEQETAKPVIGPSATPPVPTPGTKPTPGETPLADISQSSADNSGGEVEAPATLTKPQVDATREDVLKRINAMPRFTVDEKKRLSEKMETARSMDRLLVVRFDTGQTSPSRAALDELDKRIKSKDVQDKISDPTVVFVVAGYADTAGDPKANLALSQERADNVTKVLRDKTKLLNVIHSVGMGSTDLLDGKRADQNRAVEIWAVEP
jgi:outer membrane protein OmpA-like peptidoglycan-associated protein